MSISESVLANNTSNGFSAILKILLNIKHYEYLFWVSIFNEEDEHYHNYTSEASVWADKRPSVGGYIVYLLIVPMFCIIGVVTNLVSVWIFSRPRVVAVACSAYCYFKAISICDLISCVMLMGSCLARTVYHDELPWVVYDVMTYIPVSGILSNISNGLTCAVSLDRVIYMKNNRPKSTPTLCQIKVARRVIFINTLLAVVLNIPYFLIFNVTDDNYIITTDFFNSWYYLAFNILKLVILVASTIFLITSNLILICFIRRWIRTSNKGRETAEEHRKPYAPSRKKILKQTQLTMTLVLLVVLFIIGEVPMFFASRKIRSSYIFPESIFSDECKEVFQMLATVLHALHISLNIVIYASLNPPYMVELMRLTRHCRPPSDVVPYRHASDVDCCCPRTIVMPTPRLAHKRLPRRRASEASVQSIEWAADKCETSWKMKVFTVSSTAATYNGITVVGMAPHQASRNPVYSPQWH